MIAWWRQEAIVGSHPTYGSVVSEDRNDKLGARKADCRGTKDETGEKNTKDAWIGRRADVGRWRESLGSNPRATSGRGPRLKSKDCPSLCPLQLAHPLVLQSLRLS